MSKHKNHQPSIPNEAVAKSTGNAVWDNNEITYRECVGLCTIPASTTQLLRTEGLIDRLGSQRSQFVDLTKMLHRDFDDYVTRLTGIHEKHKGRMGNSVDSDDLMTAIAIHEEYHEWIASYSQVVTPTVTQILDMGQTALGVPYEKTVRGELEKHWAEQQAAAGDATVHDAATVETAQDNA